MLLFSFPTSNCVSLLYVSHTKIACSSSNCYRHVKQGMKCQTDPKMYDDENADGLTKSARNVSPSQSHFRH